jgi:endonuclease G
MIGPWIGLLLLSSLAHAQVWLPEEDTPTEIIQHSAITIGYNEDHEVPQWVAYVLRKEHLRDCFDRSENFREDVTVRTGSALPTDYRSSGYDRGHIAPAGDMKWSKQAMEESFYMSNITPQSPGMNRGRWASLELLVRAWAKEGDETIIVSGPVLQANLPQIGSTGVSIPAEHFKVLLRSRGGHLAAIAFVMSQNPTATGLQAYALPVRTVEELTGLNFFPHLSVTEQDRVEQRIAWEQWDFKAKFSYDSCSR